MSARDPHRVRHVRDCDLEPQARRSEGRPRGRRPRRGDGARILKSRVVLATGTVLLVAIHAALALRTTLTGDEAYYWTWAKDLAWTYRDHPPLVAWLVAVSTRLFGDTNLGVRFPALACGAALPALQAALAREAGLGDREAAFVGLFSSASILASAGSFVVGPDAPLSVLWLLAAIGLVRAAARADPRPLVLAALAAGLAAWAKLTALLLPGVVLLVPSLRRLFARAPMAAAAWLLLAIGALVVTRGAIAFQLRHGLAVSAPLWAAPLRWIETLGAQVLLLSPFVVWEAVRGARGGGAATRTLVWLAALPVVAVLVSALVAHTEANWAGPAHAAIFVLAARAFLARPPGAARVRLLALALTFVLVPSAVLHVHAARPLWTRADPTTRLHDGRRRAERPDGSYGDCALARYYDVTSPRCPRLRGTR